MPIGRWISRRGSGAGVFPLFQGKQRNIYRTFVSTSCIKEARGHSVPIVFTEKCGRMRTDPFNAISGSPRLDHYGLTVCQSQQ